MIGLYLRAAIFDSTYDYFQRGSVGSQSAKIALDLGS